MKFLPWLAAILIAAVIGAALGYGAAMSHLSAPMQKWREESSASFLPAQAKALQGLRDGHPESAEGYLQAAALQSLRVLASQKNEGATLHLSAETTQAIARLCDGLVPPSPTAASDSQTMAVGEACYLLAH